MNAEVVHMTSDDISPKNDLEDSNPTDAFNEPQNQEVVSVLLPQKGSTFKLKKMNLLANIKVFTEKCYNLKSSENTIGELDAGINQLTRIVDAELCRQQQNDSLVERPKTPQKRKSKTNFKVLPNKRKKHPLSDTYLFDNYDKYVIYLLNFRLDLAWLGLEKMFFPVSLYNTKQI